MFVWSKVGLVVPIGLLFFLHPNILFMSNFHSIPSLCGVVTSLWLFWIFFLAILHLSLGFACISLCLLCPSKGHPTPLELLVCSVCDLSIYLFFFFCQVSSLFSDEMFRKTAWRNTIGDAVGSHQDQALGTTMLLLKSYGPAAFLLREDGQTRNFKVKHSVILHACCSHTRG